MCSMFYVFFLMKLNQYRIDYILWIWILHLNVNTHVGYSILLVLFNIFYYVNFYFILIACCILATKYLYNVFLFFSPSYIYIIHTHGRTLYSTHINEYQTISTWFLLFSFFFFRFIFSTFDIKVVPNCTEKI